MIEALKNTWFFEEQTLAKDEVLFDEGSVDTFIYIIESGEVTIEKRIAVQAEDFKELAKLWAWQIFWEWSLNNTDPKEVRIIASADTKLLKIDASRDFEKFISKYPKEWIALLAEIINTTNKRLLEANYLVTSSYTLMKYISEIKKFNNKNLFMILDELVAILDTEFIIYIEKSPVVKDAFMFRYDTREKWKMQNEVMIIDDFIKFKETWFKESESLFHQSLKSWNEVVGYMFISGKNRLNDWQIKALGTISVTIAGFVRQKQFVEETKTSEEY